MAIKTQNSRFGYPKRRLSSYVPVPVMALHEVAICAICTDKA